MLTTVIINSDAKGGAIMYPYCDTYTWFTFTVNGSSDGLTVRWSNDISRNAIFLDLYNASIEIMTAVREMLAEQVAYGNSPPRSIRVEVLL